MFFFSGRSFLLVMQSQIIKLKLRSLAVGLLILTAAKYLFLMPNSSSYTFTHPFQVIEANQEKLVEDIIVENDPKTEGILQTFAQRRNHINNICQTNQIGRKFAGSWKSFKQSLRENNFNRDGKLLSETR